MCLLRVGGGGGGEVCGRGVCVSEGVDMAQLALLPVTCTTTGDPGSADNDVQCRLASRFVD